MRNKHKIIAGVISFFLVITPMMAMKALAVNDTVPPSSPTNLSSQINSGNQVFLQWNASTDNTGVAGYTIIRNGSVLANTTGTSYVDTSVSADTAYTYSIMAFDAAGNVSEVSSSIYVKTPASSDTEAPSAPANLVATSTSPDKVILDWADSSDNVGVTGYMVIRDGILLANTATSSYSDMSVQASTTYTYSVMAFDAAGNVSAQSNEVSITTPSPVLPSDTEAPSAPANLVATASSSSEISLDWQASSDNVGVVGYDIYRNGQLIGTSTATSTEFSDTGLNPDTLYIYHVTAFDAAGNVSAPSHKASAMTLGNGNDQEQDDDADTGHTDNGLHLGFREHSDNGLHLGLIMRTRHNGNGNHFGQEKNDSENE